jgi:hypothetical protein
MRKCRVCLHDIDDTSRVCEHCGEDLIHGRRPTAATVSTPGKPSIWGAFRAAIFGGPSPAVALKPQPAPVVGTFDAGFSAFQAAVKAAAIIPSDDAKPSTAAMTWRTGDTETVEFVADGVVIMTAGGTISAGPGFLGVVGESHYQDALQRAKRSQPGEDEPVFMATLVREPQNTYDTNAIAVLIDPFGTVGYIAREIARRMAPIIDAAAPTPVRCPAQLRGGSPTKPSIGVVLDSALATGARLSRYDPNHTPDYDRCAEYHEQRRANEVLITAIKSVEGSEPEEAIQRYRLAMQTTRDIEAFSIEHNLFPGYTGGVQEKNVKVLDRLTRCLIAAGRPKEAVAETDHYFADHPIAATLTLSAAVQRRVARHRV